MRQGHDGAVHEVVAVSSLVTVPGRQLAVGHTGMESHEGRRALDVVVPSLSSPAANNAIQVPNVNALTHRQPKDITISHLYHRQ